MPRLFMAVRVPANPNFERVLARLRGVRGVKPTEPENLHFTLRFFGDVPDAQAAALQDAMDAGPLPVPAFTVTIQGTGSFGGRQPRVIWAGCDAAADAPFGALAAAVDGLADQAALGPRDKPFAPHVTLARVKRLEGRGEKDVHSILDDERDTHYGELRVDTLALVQSTLTPNGSVYVDIAKGRLS